MDSPENLDIMVSMTDGVPPTRKRGPKPTGKGEPVLVRLQPDLLEALDRFIAGQQPGMSRPQAMRLAFRQWAAEHRFLSTTQEGIRPQDLNAANDD